MNTETQIWLHKDNAMLLIIPHNTFYALYGMSNNFIIFALKDFRAPYVCSHLYLNFERPVNPPGH